MNSHKKVGNYILIKTLGKGQFGVVYKAVDIKDKRKIFAVKCINKEKLNSNKLLLRLFQTEIAVMSKIKHSNVMHLFEYMETANNFYLVIRYCNNGDLDECIKKTGRLAESG